MLWKSNFALLRDHFGQCAVEELLWATQGSLWPACCGRATLVYSGMTLASVLWKRCFGLLRDHFGQCAVKELFGLLRDHFGQCAVEGLLWATQGSLWPVCCGRGALGYSGITLVSVLWKSYFGLVGDHFGECAAEELLWATQGSLW